MRREYGNYWMEYMNLIDLNIVHQTWSLAYIGIKRTNMWTYDSTNHFDDRLRNNIFISFCEIYMLMNYIWGMKKSSPILLVNAYQPKATTLTCVLVRVAASKLIRKSHLCSQHPLLKS